MDSILSLAKDISKENTVDKAASTISVRLKFQTDALILVQTFDQPYKKLLSSKKINECETFFLVE